MAEDHHSLRAPRWLWQQYAGVVGDIGRTPDLKLFMDWRIDNPQVVLGPDVDQPYDVLTTIRVEPERWELFVDTVAGGDCSSELRRYMRWRVQHPTEPLPGRRMPPMRRQSRRPACV